MSVCASPLYMLLHMKLQTGSNHEVFVREELENLVLGLFHTQGFHLPALLYVNIIIFGDNGIFLSAAAVDIASYGNTSVKWTGRLVTL